MSLESQICSIVNYDKSAVWGVADISYSDFSNRFSRAVVIAQKYSNFICKDNYDEERYHNILTITRNTVNKKIYNLRQLFNQNGIRSYIPQIPQRDEITLMSEFSLKYAAVNAGLGWIGKSDLLVTYEYGPRVSLGAILIDYPLNCTVSEIKNLCISCNKCIDACLWGCIKGAIWNQSLERNQLIDYVSCNNKRSELIKDKGRKHSCGFCLLACPYGK